MFYKRRGKVCLGREDATVVYYGLLAKDECRREVPFSLLLPFQGPEETVARSCVLGKLNR